MRTLMRQGGVYARLMAEQAREAAARRVDGHCPRSERARAKPSPIGRHGATVKPVTEGIIKAEGLTWLAARRRS